MFSSLRVSRRTFICIYLSSQVCYEVIFRTRCVCFIDWQKVFYRVNWTKLMQILKGTVIDWRERRLINKLYMAQSVKVRLNGGETRSVKIGRGVRQGCCLSPIQLKLYSEFLTNEALEGFWDLKIREKIIHTVKYADDLVLLAKEKRCYRTWLIN